MTEQPEDETLAWARELASDLGTPGQQDEEMFRPPGTTEPEAEVLAAMAQLPESWKRLIADIAQRIAEELTEHPGAVPNTGRHRSPGTG